MNWILSIDTFISIAIESIAAYKCYVIRIHRTTKASRPGRACNHSCQLWQWLDNYFEYTVEIDAHEDEGVCRAARRVPFLLKIANCKWGMWQVMPWISSFSVTMGRLWKQRRERGSGQHSLRIRRLRVFCLWRTSIGIWYYIQLVCWVTTDRRRVCSRPKQMYKVLPKA